jgi:hypothetical protein
MWQAVVAGMPAQKKIYIFPEFLIKTNYLIQKCNRSMHKAVDRSLTRHNIDFVNAVNEVTSKSKQAILYLSL